MNNTNNKITVIKNFFSLSLLQIFNYIFPLITFPYLVKTIGIEYYGLNTFANTIVGYFELILEFGFEVIGTRDISLHQSEKKKLDDIFSSIFYLRIVIFVFLFVIFLLLIFSFNKLRDFFLFYILTFIRIIGQIMFPVWFFQGIERMGYITIINFMTRVLFLISIFIFIKNKNDYVFVTVFNSLGIIVTSLISFFIILFYFDVKIKRPNFVLIKNYFHEGKSILLSKTFVMLYNNMNIFLLGFFTNNKIVGIYSVAEKIVALVGTLFVPANQSIFPYLSKIYKDKWKIIKIIKKISLYYFLISIFLFLFLLLFGKLIINYLVHENSIDVFNIYIILIFSIFLYPYGPLLSNLLIIYNKTRDYFIITRNTLIINLIFAFLAIRFLGAYGMGYVTIVSYFTMILLSYMKLKDILNINNIKQYYS